MGMVRLFQQEHSGAWQTVMEGPSQEASNDVGYTEVLVAGPREESGQGWTPVGQAKLKGLLMGDAKYDTMRGVPSSCTSGQSSSSEKGCV